MSAAEDTVKAFMAAFEARNFDTAKSYLTEDFIFSGWTPQPVYTQDFFTIFGGLMAGIPNLMFHFHTVHDLREQQTHSRVEATIRITGTQTEGFVLPPLGLPPIPQTAQTISLPEERWNYTVVNNKIARILVEHVPGGGIGGLLHQLGINVPIIQ
jgi:hypothetical protein